MIAWQAWHDGRKRAAPASPAASAADRIGGLTVSSGEIAELDGKIQELSTEVLDQAMKSPTPENAIAATQITNLRVRWTLWRDAHVTILEQSAVPIIGDPDVGRVFQAFVSEYNEFRRAWIAAGGTTAAAPQTTESPLDRAAGTIAGVASDVAFYGLVAVVLYALLSRRA